MSATFSEDDYTVLDDVIAAYEKHFDELKGPQQAAIESSLPPGPIRDATIRRLQSGESLANFKQAVIGRNVESLLQSQQSQVEHLADQGISYDSIVGTLRSIIDPLADRLEDLFADTPERALQATRVLGHLRAETITATGRAFASYRETALEEAHREIIRELSTPVIEVWDEVLVMPLVGVVDSRRAKQMMEQLLTRIVERQSRIVLLDITGVPAVDTDVANHFIKTAQAARLVGAQSILVGISPQVAQTLVRLGVSLTEIETAANLLTGLKKALNILGYSVDRSTDET